MSFFNINRILVPLDFSKTSLKALDYATKIAKTNSAELHLVHVIPEPYQNLEPSYFNPPPLIPVRAYEKEFIEQSDKHLSDISVRIQKKNSIQVITQTVMGKIQKELIGYAKKNKISLIVMGTHGVSGVMEFFAGSNTFRVIREAECPVLSVPGKSKIATFKTILVPFRDKPHSREKVNYAIDLALKFKASIHVLGIDTEFTKSHKRKIQLEAEQIKKIAKKYGVECQIKIISSTYAGEVVLKHASSFNADLIISMSDLDRMDITEYFTGPYAQQIVNHSTIPVLSIRPKFNPDTIDLKFY